jgi:hypothetical protein
VTVVLQADHSRVQHDVDVLEAQRQAFANERARLEQAHAAIVEKIAALGSPDVPTRNVLEAAQRLLAEQERVLTERAAVLDRERGRLEREDRELAARLGKQPRGGGPHPPASLGQREQDIVAREKALAERELGLARREEAVAGREAEATRTLGEATRALTALQAGLGSALHAGAAAAAEAKTASAASAASSVGDLDARLRADMDARGLLTADLPAPLRKLAADAAAAIGRKDFKAAQAALARLQPPLQAMRVDQAFVTAKMKRINQQLLKAQPKLDDGRQARVRALLGEVNEAFNDGHFDRANRKINELVAALAP